MAGTFRKKHNKPWILKTIESKDRKFKCRVVKALCRRSKSVYGSNVMVVSDGETSISAIFSDEAIDGLADQGFASSNWSTALLILQKYTLELRAQPGQDFGEYILYVNKFSIWDLQPGYQVKYDVKNCMEHDGVYDRLKEELRELKERAGCQTESSMTGSIALSQLLEEIARPSTCGSESEHCSEQSQESFTSGSKSHAHAEQYSKCTTDLNESLVDKLMQPFSIEEFLIQTTEASVLEKIEEWKQDYQPQQVESQPQPSEEPVESVINEQFDICAANTFSQDDAVRFIVTNPEKAKYKEAGNDVDYLGISFASTPEEKEKKEGIVEIKSSEPVCALFRQTEAESQSQGTSCLWQDELESVQFSFEQENSAPDSQGSPKENCRHTIKDSSMVKTNPEISERSHRILASKNIDMKSTSGLTLPSKEKLLKCPQKSIETEEKQICIDSSSTSPPEVMQKELKRKSSNKFDVPLAGKILKETEIQETNASRLVLHVDDLSPAEICKSTSNKSSSEECLEIGSPAAQSTQIDEAFNVMPRIGFALEKSLEKGEAEDQPENIGVKVIESSTGQSDRSSRNSVQNYESESISQVNNSISEISQNISFPAEVISHKNSVKIQTDDKKHETTDTSIDNTTKFSSQNLESSVLHKSHTNNSFSPICNLNNAMLKLAAKKKKLEALNYISKRISDVTKKPDMSDGSERFDSQDITLNNQREKSTEIEKNVEVGKEKDICLNKSENNDIYDEERDDMLPENSGESVRKVKQQNLKMLKYFVDMDSKAMELNSCFATSDKDVKKDSYKVNTQENFVETTETEYSVSSLSESEAFEEDQNDIPPPFRISLNEANLQKEKGLKCRRCENFKDSSDKKNYDQYSDQTDLEEIDETHQKCIIASSEEEKSVKVCSEKLNASSGEKRRQSLLGFPRAPEYFDTESGCRRRSERLYAKVLSCREKDTKVNGSEVSNNGLSKVLVKPNNRSDVNTTKLGDEHVGRGEYDNCEPPNYDELDNCEETNSDMNVVNAELNAEVCVSNINEELSKSNLIKETCDNKSENKPEMTNNEDMNDKLRGCKTNTFTFKDDKKNLKSALNTVPKKSNFVIDGTDIYDIRIVLERCDQILKENAKSKKKETGQNKVSEVCHLKDFTKLRSGKKVTRKKPVSEGIKCSIDNIDGHTLEENRPQLSPQKSDSIAEVQEIEKVNKNDEIEAYSTRNNSDLEALHKLKNSEIKKLSFISQNCETVDVPEKSEKLFAKISDKKDEKQERNANSVAIRKNESDKNDNAHTFEDQFKTWLGICNRKKGNGQYSLAYTEPGVHTVNIKNGQPENCEELSCQEHVDPDSSEYAKCADTPTITKGYIIDTNKDLEKDSSTENTGNSAKSSPIQNTQPFSVCQFPETQEFSPKLSESHLETSLNETFKHSSDLTNAQKSPDVDDTSVSAKYLCSDTGKPGNILKLKGHLIEDSECKDLVQNDHMRVYSFDQGNKGVKKSVNIEIKSAKINDKNLKDKESHHCLKPDKTIGTASSSLQPPGSNEPTRFSGHTDVKNSKNLQNDTERVSVRSASEAEEFFTKVLGKPEPTTISNKPKISFLKVKPAQKDSIQRKRKFEECKINSIQKNKKLKCVLKESENNLETKDSHLNKKAIEDNEGMDEINSSPDSLAEFKCNRKTLSKEKVKSTSGRHLDKEVIIVDKEKTKSLDKSVSFDKTQNPIKTYEPHKLLIDGHCFGNKVFWQNFIAAPCGDSKCISSETKNKSCAEKTNKRKLSLDCSQESQNKDNVKKYQNASNETTSNKVNTSSESLFSDENDIIETQSNSTSLLHRTGIQTKEYVAKECVRKDAKDENLKHLTTSNNEHDDLNIGNDDLRYCKKDGVLRFYRSKQKTETKGQELNVAKQSITCIGKANPRSGTTEKEKDSDHVSFDRVLLKKGHGNQNRLLSTEQKKSENKEQVSSERKSKAFKNSDSTSIDKRVFIQDWLAKHREVNKEDPSCNDFSPPESSLPSYQPVGITREPKTCREGQTVKNNDEKENSSDVTSTSESSSGSESEDPDRPMSAAEKYLMKMKTSRKKKMLLAFKSDMSNQAYTYLKSGDRL